MRTKRFSRIRIHREGTKTLLWSGFAVVAVAVALFWLFDSKLPFWVFVILFGAIYCIILNFYRCPLRYFNGAREGLVVAPADGRVIIIEEVDENCYFHDRRLKVSIFMSLWNVHANWCPTEGHVVTMRHQDGNWHKAWLPKASEENERADCVIETAHGQQVLCRLIAGAVARRIVTYAHEGEDCYIDQHLGFIKFGSRVDLFLPLDSELCIRLGQPTTGNQTVIAKLKTK